MEGMMLKLRFNVSNLRNIIVNTENGMMPELTTEMIDDLMDDVNYFDNNELFDYDENNNTDEILDLGEKVISGGGSTSTNDKKASTSDGEPESDNNESDKGDDSDDGSQQQVSFAGGASNSQIEISTGEMPNSKSTPQLTQPQPQLNHSQPQLTQSQPQLTQSQLQLTHSQQQLTQPQPQLTQPQPQLTQLTPQLQPSAFGGGGYNDIPIEEFDLDQYGGVKPDFEIKERDDEKVIENLNSQLFGIQKGGMDEIIENTKTEGIKQTFESNNLIQQQQPQQQLQQQSQQQPQQQFQQGGLNFNFNPGNSISGNNNIKSVSIDTNIKNGYIYSESKNLDPFNNI